MATIKFWSEMTKATTVDGEDKVMIGRNATGEAMYADFQYLINQAGMNSSDYIPVDGNTLPDGGEGNKVTFAGPGTYTQSGGDDVVVPENSLGIITWDGDEWSLGSFVELEGDFVSSQDFNDFKENEFQPIVDKVNEVIVTSKNMVDLSKFISGRLNEDGTLQTTPSSLSMDYISVPSDSDITISGFETMSTRRVRYAILDSENNLITHEMSKGHSDKEPITFHTPSEPGLKLAVTIAVGDSAGQEWVDGNSPYPDTFLINLGDEPIDFVHGGLTINSPAFVDEILNLVTKIENLPLIDEGEIWN